LVTNTTIASIQEKKMMKICMYILICRTFAFLVAIYFEKI